MNFSHASRSGSFVLFFFAVTTIWAQPPRNRAREKPAAPSASAAIALAPRTPELKLVNQFDRNGDQQLDSPERTAARAYLAQHPEPVEPPNLLNPLAREDPIGLEAFKLGEKISPASITSASVQPLYDPRIVRTVFLEFEDKDWEQELIEFVRTDVLIPARLTLDGKNYPGVGVHFPPVTQSASISPGYKRSFDLTFDFTVKNARLDGERRLQLRDAHTDPTYLRAFLYQRVAREYFPTPKTNFVRVVINGENWGVYTNTQPLDAAFTQENFGSADGTRWLASGRGNLAYRGNDAAAYRDDYRLLSSENPAAWTRLAELCRLLDQTPISELEAALRPYLDLERTLKFLAIETALINQGGYGSPNGSYGLYLDPTGRFHFVPQDTESSFRLLQVREIGAASGQPRNRNVDLSQPPPNTGIAPPVEIPVPISPNGTPGDFPRRADTDLAMLLSYSFINKVDRDNDGRLSRDEWTRFARAWFLVVDEDQTGVINRDQFITSVRNLVTPPSMRDPKVKQTFAEDDAAFLIGRDLFASMTHDASNRVDRNGFVAAFAKWFTDWTDAKSGQLTQPSIQRGLNSLLSQSVFAADQLYVKHSTPLAQDDDRGPGGRAGGGRGGERGGGSGLSPQLGLSLPGGMRLGGLGGRGGRGGSGGRTLLTFNEELHPLTWAADPDRPLFTKLLAVPSFRARYVGYLEEISKTWLNWEKLGPVAKEAHQSIAREVERETHRTFSYARFVQELDQDTTESDLSAREMGEILNLKAFVAERCTYLLKQISR